MGIEQVCPMFRGSSAELMMPKGHEKETQAKIKRYMTIMDSMTNKEFGSSNTKLINASRILWIAKGCGRQVREVMEMFEEYKQRAKILSKFKIPKSGEMSALSRNMNIQNMSEVIPRMLKQLGGL
ncbi:hypothetical protein ACH5RR_008208 [Cinchona calisaya]|uniref:Signal recognition particle SRP54 subunit M-domain domain-containing protein n=1 Tax=Cinchona calisaya TaxID=153742 RepID=A0ABD3AAQ2_9GENT